MFECPVVKKDVIRGHYDLSTIFYRLLWGKHIHHGLWNGNESCRLAQIQLTETLANLAGIQGGEVLLDVGCGMGGSSIHLARTRQCQATGVTISLFQRRWAAASARFHRVKSQSRFLHADADQMEFPKAAFDVVWSIECTEHLFDKPGFFQKAAQWLNPGGRVAICAWLAGENLDSKQKQQVFDVCEGFFCPSLGSAEDYQHWMRDAGLITMDWQDWTQRVTRTWEICERRVRRSGVRWIAKLMNQETVMFLDRFPTIRQAYESGAMQYGCFVAQKPQDSSASNDRFS